MRRRRPAKSSQQPGLCWSFEPKPLSGHVPSSSSARERAGAGGAKVIPGGAATSAALHVWALAANRSQVSPRSPSYPTSAILSKRDFSTNLQHNLVCNPWVSMRTGFLYSLYLFSSFVQGSLFLSAVMLSRMPAPSHARCPHAMCHTIVTQTPCSGLTQGQTPNTIRTSQRSIPGHRAASAQPAAGSAHEQGP